MCLNMKNYFTKSFWGEEVKYGIMEGYREIKSLGFQDRLQGSEATLSHGKWRTLACPP